MPTDDQTRSARLHGEALLEARRVADDPAYADLLARLSGASPAERAEVAGRLATEAFAALPDGDREDVAHQLIAAGLTLVAGVVDHDRLAETVRGASTEEAPPTDQRSASTEAPTEGTSR